MDLTQVRSRIDEIDTELLELFTQRMEIARLVAEAKRGTKKAVFDPVREREKLSDVAMHTPDAYRPQAVALFSLLMSMNKAEQQRVLAANDEQATSAVARRSLMPVDTPFPEVASVACQGVEAPTAKLPLHACSAFPPSLISLHFEGVCRAVRDGFCEYGVLPIENSTAGSVNAVYDLLAELSFQHRAFLAA